MGRRAYGTGSLMERTDSAGRVTYYGRWYANGRKLKRRLGVKRSGGERDGLTVKQAEEELRRQMGPESTRAWRGRG